MKHVNTLEYHLQNPGASVATYVRNKRLELAHEIRGTRKIYLDTKFWICLRDARLGKPASASVGRLLTILEELVRQKKVLCPLSVDTFAEVFKQSDPATLRATTDLIDDLSMGVTILEHRERVELEAFHFIREKSKGTGTVRPIDDLVWTKTAYVLGFVTPSFYKLPVELNTALQKSFVDQMWVTTLGQMLSQDEANTKDRQESWFPTEITNQLNLGKSASTHEYSSFKQLFLNELAGILDAHKPMFSDLMRHIRLEENDSQESPMNMEFAEAARYVTNLIFHAFRLNKIKSEFPTFRVSAGLHAAMRWDRTRKYKVNDLHDIHHAVAALPYFDWFFTEHSLRHLVADKNLNFSALFKCKTLSEFDEALAAMINLSTS